MNRGLKGGAEYDVFGKGRKLYCYLNRAGVCAKIKRRIGYCNPVNNFVQNAAQLPVGSFAL